MGKKAGAPVQYAEVRNSGSALNDAFQAVDNNTQAERSWRAVITMSIALVMGALFATAQHLINSYLNARDVNSVHVTSAWVARINTALAFAVKTCFVITIGVAFIQRQWFNLHRESVQVLEIDILTGILSNIFNFFSASVWLHHPLLATIALLAWMLPIATIITPGSISLDQRPETNTTSLQVPQYNWAGDAYSSLPCCGAFGSVFAQLATYRVPYTAAMTGDSLTLPSRYQNESYHLQFYGPTVECARNSTLGPLLDKYWTASHSSVLYTYLSWAPSNAEEFGLTLANLQSESPQLTLNTTFASLDETSLNASTIYVMVLEKPFQSVVTECKLYNATYEVDFNFTYPGQRHSITSVDLINPVAATKVYAESEGATPDMRIASYAGVMDAFGRVLVGSYTNDQYGTNISVQTSWNLLSIAWDDPIATQQGLESLFQNITLSYLSDSAFTKNSSQAAFVPVTATFWPVKYVYSPRELWLPYGMNCAVALGCLLIGVHAFIRNGGRYQDIFSTFVRATSYHELREHVNMHDSCADPLPTDLGKLQVRLMGA